MNYWERVTMKFSYADLLVIREALDFLIADIRSANVDRTSAERLWQRFDAEIRNRKLDMELMSKVIKTLESQKWIPVSEPPKETGEYIVTIRWRNHYHYGDYKYLVVKRKYYADVKTWDDSLVIAYMPKPLPEPYAEREGQGMTEEDKLYAEELRKRALADYERLDHAINELERQMTPRKNHETTAKDCISKEELLKRLNERKMSIPISETYTEDHKVGWKDGIFWSDVLEIFEELEGET